MYFLSIRAIETRKPSIKGTLRKEQYLETEKNNLSGKYTKKYSNVAFVRKFLVK